MYEPLFSDETYDHMRRYGISYLEVLAAFHSQTIQHTPTLGVLAGLAKFSRKVVAAIYTKNTSGQWVILSCVAQSLDYPTLRF